MVVSPAAGLSRSRCRARFPSLALGDSLAVRRGLAAKSGEGVAWSDRRGWRAGGGPEFGGPAGSGDLGAGGAGGELQRVERALDLVGWPVVLEGVEIWLRVSPTGVGLERGVDLFGERIAGGALQRPGGGPGGVVPQRERGLQVFGVDLPLAVGERVDEREADHVRFGARQQCAGDPGVLGGRELGVGVVPKLAGVRGELHAAGGAGVCDRGAEHTDQAGAGEWVGAAAFGEQAGAATGAEHKPVRHAVGELDVGEVVAQLGLGDVTDQRDVRLACAGGRGAGQQLQRPAVPGLSGALARASRSHGRRS